MPYLLEPLVAGQLGPDTILDSTVHPPRVEYVAYELDARTDEDLLESFPVFLVSEELAAALLGATLDGFSLGGADVLPSREYVAVYGAVPHKTYRWLRLRSSERRDCWLDDRFRLCVSDRMYEVIERHRVEHCDVTFIA